MRWMPALAAVLLTLLLTPRARASDLGLWVDVDGTTYLHNSTGGPLSFDGYQITSDLGTLNPAGWDSISDRIPGRISELIEALGAGALTFGEANPNANNLAELNLGGAATLAAGAKFSIGKPFGPSYDPTLRGYYKLNSSPTPVPFDCLPYLTCLPEPSTGALALCGCGAMLLLRRRRTQPALRRSGR